MVYNKYSITPQDRLSFGRYLTIMNKTHYDEIIAFHPGYYLKDMIEAMGITQEEFAKRLGTSGKTLSELLNGKINLSDSLALNLSKMFGTSVDVWLNLQKTYTRKVLEIS